MKLQQVKRNKQSEGERVMKQARRDETDIRKMSVWRILVHLYHRIPGVFWQVATVVLFGVATLELWAR